MVEHFHGKEGVTSSSLVEGLNQACSLMVEQRSPKSLVKVQFLPGLPNGIFEVYVMKTTTFIQECKVELEKVQWPSREEVVNSTIVVLFTVIFFSLFLLIIWQALSLLFLLLSRQTGG